MFDAVDNYQGEESDIIVGSFVRSNDGGQMGFVGDPNRLNVAISRARCYIVISSCCFYFIASFGWCSVLRVSCVPWLSVGRRFRRAIGWLVGRYCI